MSHQHHELRVYFRTDTAGTPSKKEIEERLKEARSGAQKERFEQTLSRIDKAIEANERARDKAREEKQKRKEERDRDDWDRFDPWGRY